MAVVSGLSSHSNHGQRGDTTLLVLFSRFLFPLGKIVQTHLRSLVPLSQVVESDGLVGGFHHHQGGTCGDSGRWESEQSVAGYGRKEGRRDVLVKRGEPVPSDIEGPILVCTGNDDLEAVLDATPTSRWREWNAGSLACK
ncbi:hypothetical protein MLD38_008024 [Melastoma candidum]|uniref:Uncharacterized protein n=1 Tax=Melastoma candidum TaxID=119954 RepID=A0ACB9RWP8_9MYRT|nr:hypothetical protein MLD38_008024 [Melastoma candidum]